MTLVLEHNFDWSPKLWLSSTKIIEYPSRSLSFHTLRLDLLQNEGESNAHRPESQNVDLASICHDPNRGEAQFILKRHYSIIHMLVFPLLAH